MPVALVTGSGGLIGSEAARHFARQGFDVIGVDNMMWGSDYPHSESTFPQSRKILAEILAGVPEDEQAKIVGGNTARVYGFEVAQVAALA